MYHHKHSHSYYKIFFNPNSILDYPASSEWVTAIGGTMYQTANVLSAPLPPFCSESTRTCAGSGVEIVSQVPEALITSGGGFSNYEGTPTWQQAAVSAYLSSGALLPPSSDFNSTGRGILISIFLFQLLSNFDLNKVILISPV